MSASRGPGCDGADGERERHDEDEQETARRRGAAFRRDRSGRRRPDGKPVQQPIAGRVACPMAAPRDRGRHRTAGPSPPSSALRGDLRRRCSKVVMSVIAELRPQSIEDSSEPGSSAGGAHPKRAARARTSRGRRRSGGRPAPDPSDRAWPWRSAGRCRPLVSPGRRTPASPSATDELDDRPASSAAQRIARLVRGDRDEPRAESMRLAQRWQASPGERPRRLHGVLGDRASPQIARQTRSMSAWCSATICVNAASSPRKQRSWTSSEAIVGRLSP